MRAIAPQRFVLPIRCLTLGAIRALGAKTRMGCRTPSAGKSTFLRKTGDRLSATAKAAAAWSGFQGRAPTVQSAAKPIDCDELFAIFIINIHEFESHELRRMNFFFDKA